MSDLSSPPLSLVPVAETAAAPEAGEGFAAALAGDGPARRRSPDAGHRLRGDRPRRERRQGLRCHRLRPLDLLDPTNTLDERFGLARGVFEQRLGQLGDVREPVPLGLLQAADDHGLEAGWHFGPQRAHRRRLLHGHPREN